MRQIRISNLLSDYAVTPVIIFFAAFALFFYVPGESYAIDSSEYEYEADEGLHQEEWYDPSDWFDEPGEGISYESDWYDYSYAYDNYYGNDIYGYYGDDYYYDDDYGFNEFDDYDYDYYTDDWYEDRGVFEE